MLSINTYVLTIRPDNEICKTKQKTKKNPAWFNNIMHSSFWAVNLFMQYKTLSGDLYHLLFINDICT